MYADNEKSLYKFANILFFFVTLCRNSKHGVLAHLVERNVRNVKVRGSSPLYSTPFQYAQLGALTAF